MSSSTYSTSLTPDPWLRIVVITVGRLLAAAGMVIILTLPLDQAVRFFACLAWLAVLYRELTNLQWGFDSFSRIRLLSDGELTLLDGDQNWVPAELLNGSVLCAKVAWIRIETANGRQFAELITGDSRQSQEWRRLQVIWRHIGVAR